MNVKFLLCITLFCVLYSEANSYDFRCPHPRALGITCSRRNNRQCSDNRRCGRGEICCFISRCGDICIKRPKPIRRTTIRCPPRNTVSSRGRRCRRDWQCRGRQICCRGRGGRRSYCTRPLKIDGRCPRPNILSRKTRCNYRDRCSNKRRCRGGKKCCFVARCGLNCVDVNRLQPRRNRPPRRTTKKPHPRTTTKKPHPPATTTKKPHPPPTTTKKPHPTTPPPTTQAPVTAAPVTEAPVTAAPVTEAPVTAAP